MFFDVLISLKYIAFHLIDKLNDLKNVAVVGAGAGTAHAVFHLDFTIQLYF